MVLNLVNDGGNDNDENDYRNDDDNNDDNDDSPLTNISLPKYLRRISLYKFELSLATSTFEQLFTDINLTVETMDMYDGK